MPHDWQYQDKEYRKCRKCLIEEMWDDDHNKWIWMSSEDFMDCLIQTCRGEEF